MLAYLIFFLFSIIHFFLSFCSNFWETSSLYSNFWEISSLYSKLPVDFFSASILKNFHDVFLVLSVFLPPFFYLPGPDSVSYFMVVVSSLMYESYVLVLFFILFPEMCWVPLSSHL